MKQRLRLGKISGIPLYVHWTFPLLIAYFVYDGMSRGMDTIGLLWLVGFILAIFGCVVLHELGHSLSARRYGIGTEDITLLPIGGVARLKSMPKQPWREIVVAVMGPMVNVAIATALFVYFLLTSQGIFDTIPEEADGLVIDQSNFLAWLFITNIGLVIFNCIPAFPMDGGRVLRGLLALRFRRVTATKIASYLGRAFAIVFAILSFMPGGSPMLILIAIFIYVAASQEYYSVQTEEALDGKTVRDVMRTQFTLLPIDKGLNEITPYLTSTAEQGFLVVESTQEETDLRGVITRLTIIRALKYHKNKDSFLSKILYRFRKINNGFYIHELMNTRIEYVYPELSLQQVYHQMTHRQIPVMPVYENGEVAGVVDYYQIREYIKLNG